MTLSLNQDTAPSGPSRLDGPLAGHIPFWHRLGQAERRAIAAAGRSQWHPAGTVICAEGSHGDTLYIVESGRVTVSKSVGTSQPVLIGMRGPGEILGEMSLIGEQTRSASLTVAQDSQLLHIAAADFARLMSEHRGISWAVLSVLNDRLQEADMVRTLKARQEEALTRSLEQLSSETRHLTELAHARQETIELLVHDLRTPLAVVQGCLEIITSYVPAQEQGIMQMAQHNNERALGMLKQLLEIARVDNVEQKLIRRPVDLPALLFDAVEDIRLRAECAGIDLALEPIAPLPAFQADPSALRRVLDNLVGNAISYTPQGGRVTVAAVVLDDIAAQAVTISVTDTGPGVPAEHRKRIFERFVRLPNTGDSRRGYGLGLYYCRQVVQAHGGRIWVEPGPGGIGSRFALLLPVVEGDRD